MENIDKLIQNSDFSFEMQTNLYSNIENVSIEIDAHKERYEECKKRFMAAEAELNKAIAKGDYAAKLEAAQDIFTIMNELHETRERIKELTSNLQGLYNELMDHQKSDEHIYVLPRQQAFELLKALTEGIKANTDFESLKLSIATSFLQK